MAEPVETIRGTDFTEELRRRKQIIADELRRRTRWFVRLRWFVPPTIFAGALAGGLAGFSFVATPVYFVAALILAYNGLFFWIGRTVTADGAESGSTLRGYAYAQVGCDYAAMFLLVHFTGGAASPFIFFFILHVVFAAILLRPLAAYGFAALAAAGMIFHGFAEYLMWMPHHGIEYAGTAIDLAHQPTHMAVELAFFSASAFAVAGIASNIVRSLRERIVRLSSLSDTLVALNGRLDGLYALIQAIGTRQKLDAILQVVTEQLAEVMQVQATSVKLLSDDRRTLRYASAFGLPATVVDRGRIEVVRSPLNRRIIDGESYVTGDVSESDSFQFGVDLREADLRSVLFVPLTVDERVIGILGAYCRRRDRFDPDDVSFFRRAGKLVAIALDNARAYEHIERLSAERTRFMMRLAHNLRAPCGAISNIVDVIRGGYLGAVSEQQGEYLRRIDRRARTMHKMIEEILTLATNEIGRRAFTPSNVAVCDLARRIERTFQDGAHQKGLRFTVTCPDDLQPVRGDFDLLEQMLENLVSNAVKYTPAGGEVFLTFEMSDRRSIAIEIKDTGIGVPSAEIPKLFREFFRAENAKEVEEIGTGLGLAIVKDIVDQHGGSIVVRSVEGQGSVFRVLLPVATREVDDGSGAAKH